MKIALKIGGGKSFRKGGKLKGKARSESKVESLG